MRVGVLCDYLEEQWPSMDLCGEMLLQHWPAGKPAAGRIRPPFRSLFRRLPAIGKRRAAWNADRLWNRFWGYPCHLRRVRSGFDLFHLVDHSYAQLLLGLPAGRVGVFCHDLDTFRSVLEPAKEPRPAWYRAMTRRILAGFSRAALVFHTTLEIRRQIEAHGLARGARLVHAPLGVAPVFQAAASDDRGEAGDWRARVGGRPFLVHVGSCIPRKRIDILLRVFAGLREGWPELRLVKVGAELTAEQQALAEALGVASSVICLGFQPSEVVAAVYRGAALVLQPSEAEGFGLPVAEALACGAIVVASELPTVREVGGDAVVYCPVADVEAWVRACSGLLEDPTPAPAREERLARSRRFSWAAHAATVAGAYRQLGEELPGCRRGTASVGSRGA